MASTHDFLPYFAEGTVVSGFGRGSKELGIPTANFPEDVIRRLPAEFDCGVYYGWAKVNGQPTVHKMVMCVGWNPYYHNTVKTMETHIMHQFESDFYGDHLKIVACGYIRPMCDFTSLDALITAIHSDIREAETQLDLPLHSHYKDHPFFHSPPGTFTCAGQSVTTASCTANMCQSKEITVPVDQTCGRQHGLVNGQTSSLDEDNRHSNSTNSAAAGQLMVNGGCGCSNGNKSGDGDSVGVNGSGVKVKVTSCCQGKTETCNGQGCVCTSKGSVCTCSSEGCRCNSVVTNGHADSHSAASICKL